MRFDRIVVMSAVCLGALAACGQPAEEASAENQLANEAAQEPTVLPIADPPLDRQALLLAAIRAASDFSAGRNLAEAQRSLDGKRIELRLRFGCPGWSADSFEARFDESDRTLRLRAAPDVDKTEPLIAAVSGEHVEAVEGFWIPRPWVLQASCPAPGPQPGPHGDAEEGAAIAEKTTQEPIVAPSKAGGRVALVQLFTSADPRTRRRDSRAYQTTQTIRKDEKQSASGYDLVISGRLKKLADGRVIACAGKALEKAPDCLISVVLDRVRMERADTRALLAEWGAA